MSKTLSEYAEEDPELLDRIARCILKKQNKKSIKKASNQFKRFVEIFEKEIRTPSGSHLFPHIDIKFVNDLILFKNSQRIFKK